MSKFSEAKGFLQHKLRSFIAVIVRDYFMNDVIGASRGGEGSSGGVGKLKRKERTIPLDYTDVYDDEIKEVEFEVEDDEFSFSESESAESDSDVMELSDDNSIFSVKMKMEEKVLKISKALKNGTISFLTEEILFC